MGFTLKLLLILFTINALLYFGGYQVNIDVQNNILGLVFDTTTLNTTINNPQATTTLTNVVPINQTFFNVGSSLGLLFTPISFIFSFVSFMFGIFLAPLALFNIAGMPFIFKIIFGGGLMVAEVVLMLSLLTGRDI